MVQTFAEVERQQWESMQNEWEREKHKILNTLLGSGPDTFEFQQETEVGVAFLCVCIEVGGGGGGALLVFLYVAIFQQEHNCRAAMLQWLTHFDRFWGCTSGEVYVPSIYSHARWEVRSGLCYVCATSFGC